MTFSYTWQRRFSVKFDYAEIFSFITQKFLSVWIFYTSLIVLHQDDSNAMLRGIIDIFITSFSTANYLDYSFNV